MGHACAVFDGKMWILGGMDEDGNTLSDVWCLGTSLTLMSRDIADTHDGGLGSRPR